MQNMPKLTDSDRLYIPVLVIAVTLFLLVVFQATLVLREHNSLKESYAGQTEPTAQLQRIGNQFQSLVMGTQQLANEGHTEAKNIMEQLARLGVTVTPEAPAAAPTTPPTSTAVPTAVKP